MALTGLSIHLNKGEYSKYEAARSVVKARIIPVPATGLAAEPVVVAIEKKGVVIATRFVTFQGDNPKGMLVEFDLNEIVDADGTTHINRGDYKVTATQGDLTETATFKAVIITADEMRKSYCQGLHLVAGAKMAPKRQPSVVTGVTITNVAKGTRKGVSALVFDAAAKTLSWGGGIAIPITEESEEEILLDTKGTYIEVEIDFYSLPAANAAEGILLDAEELSNEYLSSEIEKATQEVESYLKIMLEPTRVATEPYFSNPAQGEYFDKAATPRAYYEKDFNRRGLGWHLDLPYHQVGKVSDLAGYIGNTKALELKSGALSVNRKSGTVDVLPYDSQYTMFYTFFLGINFWGVREFIADFWRYTAIIGLNERDGKIPAEIIKMIGYTAAMPILIVAEQSYRAGMTSESISKDGVSRSQSYNAKGVYDTAIQEYKEWLKIAGPRYRTLYRGIPMMVV
jgi:hypothetical protein